MTHTSQEQSRVGVGLGGGVIDNYQISVNILLYNTLKTLIIIILKLQRKPLAVKLAVVCWCVKRPVHCIQRPLYIVFLALVIIIVIVILIIIVIIIFFVLKIAIRLVNG